MPQRLLVLLLGTVFSMPASAEQDDPVAVRLGMKAMAQQIAVQAFATESVFGPFGLDRDPIYVLDGILGDIRNDMKAAPDGRGAVLRDDAMALASTALQLAFDACKGGCTASRLPEKRRPLR